MFDGADEDTRSSALVEGGASSSSFSSSSTSFHRRDDSGSTDSTDDELLAAAKQASRGGSTRRRMRLLSRSFSKDTTSGSSSSSSSSSSRTSSRDGNATDEEDEGEGRERSSSLQSSLSSSDMSLMRRSAPLRRASSSVSTARVGERTNHSHQRGGGGRHPRHHLRGPRSGARSVSNTPRGSPTPEDAECAAIIQAVMHQVSETTRLNPSPPPDDLDIFSGSMLPTVSRPKIPDLKCIEMQTLCSLMDGSWKDTFSKFIVVDCRFHYEYSGGHIRSAVHCPEPKDVITQFFKEPPSMSDHPVCIVFHCEFSKNRAPKM